MCCLSHCFLRLALFWLRRNIRGKGLVSLSSGGGGGAGSDDEDDNDGEVVDVILRPTRPDDNDLGDGDGDPRSFFPEKTFGDDVNGSFLWLFRIRDDTWPSRVPSFSNGLGLLLLVIVVLTATSDGDE